MKLSIIVPVYQVEQYVRACVESIFQQGIADADLEVLLIDDGTEDDSFGQIADLIDSHANVTVVRQLNRGLSVARNNGLAKATGDYVMFLDSDDLLVPNSLPSLLREAVRQGPDMLIAGFVKLTNDEIDSFGHRRESCLSTSVLTATTGMDFFLGPFNPRECYVWRTLYRKAFLDANGLRFIEGIYFEDVPFTTQCYLKAGLCLYTSQVIYIYRQRTGSICSTMTVPKVIDMNKVLTHLWEMYKGDVSDLDKLKGLDKLKSLHGRRQSVKAQLMNTIFVTFCTEAWFITHNKQLLARRHEIVADLRLRIPDLHFNGGLKQWLNSCLFRLMPNTYLWLRGVSS